MAKTKLCGATITLDEAHDNKVLDCDMELPPGGGPHVGPLHYDTETGAGWVDPELPTPQETP